MRPVRPWEILLVITGNLVALGVWVAVLWELCLNATTDWPVWALWALLFTALFFFIANILGAYQLLTERRPPRDPDPHG